MVVVDISLEVKYIMLYKALYLFLIVSVVLAQSAKENVFGDIEKLLNEAKEQGAEYLSPENYQKALEKFREADKDYMNNKSTRDVRDKLVEAREYCNRALEAVNLAIITLKVPIKAREDAQKATADQFAKELYMKAEEKFSRAVREIENGDIEDARETGSEAEVLYRQSELKAIKDKILVDARKFVDHARRIEAEKYAPQTFQKSVSLLQQVESLLISNRYASEEAGSKAQECVYEANHAIYLTEKIRNLSENEQNWEKMILEFEQIIGKLTELAGEKARFDQGFKAAVDVISLKLETLQTENEQLLAENTMLQQEYSEAKEKATTSTAELEKQRKLEEKINKIKNIFAPSEAKVTFDSEKLVVSLFGLNFPSGRAIIQPEYFSLLTKVQNVIREFPDKHILLEGHTDSQGNPSSNKQLSEERAQAVVEYIIANMGLGRDQISAVGWGDTKPVASNKTEEGRSLNRRIDVVINVVN
jgi:OOP family OmpA-OmpF porin